MKGGDASFFTDVSRDWSWGWLNTTKLEFTLVLDTIERRDDVDVRTQFNLLTQFFLLLLLYEYHFFIVHFSHFTLDVIDVLFFKMTHIFHFSQHNLATHFFYNLFCLRDVFFRLLNVFNVLPWYTSCSSQFCSFFSHKRLFIVYIFWCFFKQARIMCSYSGFLYYYIVIPIIIYIGALFDVKNI